MVNVTVRHYITHPPTPTHTPTHTHTHTHTRFIHPSMIFLVLTKKRNEIDTGM